MYITDLPAYKRIKEKFDQGEFHKGEKSELSIYNPYKNIMTGDLDTGYYVGKIAYQQIKFCDVPLKFRTRDFFINTLSAAQPDVLDYVKKHLVEEFDRQFFKDYIESNLYALSFDENCFEYMPIEYLDEELISCAFLAAVEKRYSDRRGDFKDFFYSVARRNPEVLTQDFWTLGARLFASKINGVNKFLNITPEKYRTKEYYFAMCLRNNTCVMEDIPKEILTTEFLLELINESIYNIKCFTAEALEKKAFFSDKKEKMKFWQVAIKSNGFLAKDIPLNSKRVDFFFENYSKDSNEYKNGYCRVYTKYLEDRYRI